MPTKGASLPTGEAPACTERDGRGGLLTSTHVHTDEEAQRTPEITKSSDIFRRALHGKATLNFSIDGLSQLC